MRSASSASICSRPGFGRRAGARGQVLGQPGDRLLGVALVGAEDARGAALDPADRVDARNRLAVRRQDPAAVVRQDEAALVERHAGQRDRPVPDRTQHEAALDRLQLVGRGLRPKRPVVGAHDLVAADVDRLHPALAADLHRRAQEAQHDGARGVRLRLAGRELAQQLDVLARREGAVLGEPLGGQRVELDFRRVHPQVHAVHPPELTQLGTRERGLRGPAPPEHDHLLDPALPQRVERVVGDVGARELVGAQGQHARDVGRDVAVADHHRSASGEVELEVAVVRMAVVPGHELGGGPAAGQVLARDAERLVRLGAGRVDHGRVVAHQLVVRDVHAHLDVSEEAAVAPEGLLVEGLVQPLDLLMVGRNAGAEQAPRRREPLEQVDLHVAARTQ